jgi:hypothetical protein
MYETLGRRNSRMRRPPPSRPRRGGGDVERAPAGSPGRLDEREDREREGTDGDRDRRDS